MKASTPIDTQERKRRENQEKARRNEKHETITDRFKRGAAEALHDFGMLEIRAAEEKIVQTVEKIAQAVDDFRQRQEEAIKAEWQAESARLDTKKKKLGLGK